MKILKVVVVEFYEIEAVCKGNGWTTEQVIEDWFENGRINHSHVSREHCQIGNARTFINAEEITPEEFRELFAEEEEDGA